MARFVDELHQLSNKHRRHFKRALKTLSDDYIIRSPVGSTAVVASLVIEKQGCGMVLIGVHGYAPQTDDIAPFHEMLAELQALDFQPINYIAVIPDYDSTGDLFRQADDTAVLMDQQVFFDDLAQVLTEQIVKCGPEQLLWLQGTLFPESKVHQACTTRYRPSTEIDATLQPLFLDFDQEWAAKMDIFSREIDLKADETFSVRLLNGVAGSGKTLILLNRALLYCQQFPEHQVLLLIHNRPVTLDIKFKLQQHLGGIPSNLTIRTFHAHALAQSRKTLGYWGEPVYYFNRLPAGIVQLFSENAAIFQQLNIDAQQLWQECEYINETLLTDIDAYLAIERQGRGFGLQRSQRLLIWDFYQNLRYQLYKGRVCLPSMYIRQMVLNPKYQQALTRFDHILLDEVQFFAPSWLALIKYSLVANGQLFMCADPNQGFLKDRLSWKQVGLDVVGRTKKLRYSYRTTAGILTAASALLTLLDDNSEDCLLPQFDKMQQGPKPVLIYSPSWQLERARFINELQGCLQSQQVPANQVLVLHGGNSQEGKQLLQQIEQVLGAGSVLNFNDQTAQPNDNKQQLKLASIASCTGMEAAIVFVVGLAQLLAAVHKVDLTEQQRLVKQDEVYRKLYVAMTRAGQRLVMFSTEPFPAQLTPFLTIENGSLEQ